MAAWWSGPTRRRPWPRRGRSGQEGSLLPRADDGGADRAGGRPPASAAAPAANWSAKPSRSWTASAGSTSRPAGSGWLPIERHGLPKAIDKVLAVAGAVTVRQLRTALSRNRRLWEEPPPENVLLEFCRQMPGVRVEGDRIIADPPRDWREVADRRGGEAGRRAQGPRPGDGRGAMEDLCVAGGMNRFSFHAFVSWSPVIAQYGHSVYGLLGPRSRAEQVQDLLGPAPRRPREPPRAGLPRLDRRRPGLALLPALEGRQHLRRDHHPGGAEERRSAAASSSSTPTAAQIGTLATKDGRAWGLGAFLRKQGAQIGDHIVLTLDLKNRTAVVTWDERARRRRIKDVMRDG